jgi:hypothetical protein
MLPHTLLRQWLADRLPPEILSWFDEQAECIRLNARDADVYRAFSLCSRRIEKQPLCLTASEIDIALKARPGWHPQDLRTDEAARLYLLLISAGDPDAFFRRIERLYATADVNELVTLYRGLPLYPEPERYRLRAAEGIRSNMRVVFEAVAHNNPYPGEQLPGIAWNQMVLKALFVGVPLYPIMGLDERASPELARMLCDYAHERRSAGRPVNPELWRCVGPFATGSALDDLQHVLETGTHLERAAAALALRGSTDRKAQDLLKTVASFLNVNSTEEVSWKSLAVPV